MIRPRFIRWLAVFVVLLASPMSHATPPLLQIEDPWIPEAPPVSAVLAGYLTLVNTGKHDLTIVSVGSESFDRVEIHRTVMNKGMARMEAQDKLIVPAGDRVVLKRGGLHLMLINPKQKLKSGDDVDISIKLSGGETVTARLPVKRVTGATDDPHQHHHH